MRKQMLRRFLALALMLCLVLGCLPGASAADTSVNLELEQTPATVSPETGSAADGLLNEPADDEVLRVIIRFRSAPLTEKGYSTMGVSETRRPWLTAIS